MLRHLFLFLACSISCSTISAQKNLAGLWEGILSLKGKEYKFEILFTMPEKGRFEGKTYIYESERDIVEASIHGKLHQDRSMNLYDLEVSYTGPSEWVEIYKKNYQLVWHRSIFQSKLEGYWQERIPFGVNEKTKRGRIFLKKIKDDPNKV